MRKGRVFAFFSIFFMFSVFFSFLLVDYFWQECYICFHLETLDVYL